MKKIISIIKFLLKSRTQKQEEAKKEIERIKLESIERIKLECIRSINEPVINCDPIRVEKIISRGFDARKIEESRLTTADMTKEGVGGVDVRKLLKNERALCWKRLSENQEDKPVETIQIDNSSGVKFQIETSSGVKLGTVEFDPISIKESEGYLYTEQSKGLSELLDANKDTSSNDKTQNIKKKGE